MITRLLIKDKTKRLGFKGVEEILEHPFFSGIDIPTLEAKKINPPFKPDFGSEGDTKFFNVKGDSKDLAETYIPEAKIKKVEKNKDQFKDFDTKN